MAAVPAGSGGRLGRYQILGRVGAGGMGAVYKGLDPETGREVALKLLPPDSASQPRKLERFRREAKHGAKLQHENIVALYEFGESDGIYFLAMEYVDGVNVEQLVKERGPLPPDDARQITLQVAKALDHFHQVGVVHRDIKPANILLIQRNGRLIAKLADMGLARAAEDEESRVTSDGTTVGTIDYMAPEQARDSGAADIRTDMYALGCSLYHMLSGAPPFARGSLLDRVMKHAKAEPADLRETNPDIPPELWAVCKRLLAKKPRDRYQTPAELLVDLMSLPAAPAGTSAGYAGYLAPADPAPAPVEGRRKTEVRRDTALGEVPAKPARRPRPTAPPAAQEAAAGPSEGERRAAASQFERGAEAVKTGNLDYGMMLLSQCCRLDPGNLAYRQALRRAQLEKHALAGGRAWLGRLTAWYYRARLLLAKRRGDHLQVMQEAEEVLTRVPHDDAARLEMAEAAGRARLPAVGIWILEELRAVDPHNLPAARALARLLEVQKEWSRALALWQTIQRAAPEDVEARQKIRDLSVHESAVWKGRGRPARARGDGSDQTPPRDTLIT